nr:MAG TPA: hypothetical protein [Caudoviricetes sp.]
MPPKGNLKEVTGLVKPYSPAGLRYACLSMT